MANITVNPQVARPRRYTVPYLLQLSQMKDTAFDLSKFTYDAAKAGVVPPLGDCIVAPKRLNNPKRRGWSTESYEPRINSDLSQDSKMAGIPLREPRLPPTDPKKQKAEGFARFLEKHSSPTHQRVTAGGRIVPMEKRTQPPILKIPKTDLSTETIKSLNHTDGDNNFHFDLGPDHGLEFHDVAAYMNHAANLSKKIDVHAQLFAEGVNHQLPDTLSASMSYIPFSYVPDTAAAPYGIGSLLEHPSCFTNSFLPEGLNDLGLTPQISGGNFTAMIPSFAIPYPVLSAMSQPSSVLAPVFGVQNQNYISLQQSLARAEGYFHDLERQLTSLDRHRAMTCYDPTLAEQRMVIVQQRASAKENVTMLRAQLAMMPPPFENHPSPQGYGQLHGNTQLYLSHIARAATNPLPPKMNSLSSDPSASSTEIAIPSKERKIIPIVPPTPQTPNTGRDGGRDDAGPRYLGTSISSPGEGEFDCWGARAEPMPLSIERQQRHILQKLQQETNHTESEEGFKVPSQHNEYASFPSTENTVWPSAIAHRTDMEQCRPREAHTLVEQDPAIVQQFTNLKDSAESRNSHNISEREHLPVIDIEPNYWAENREMTKETPPQVKFLQKASPAKEFLKHQMIEQAEQGSPTACFSKCFDPRKSLCTQAQLCQRYGIVDEPKLASVNHFPPRPRKKSSLETFGAKFSRTILPSNALRREKSSSYLDHNGRRARVPELSADLLKSKSQTAVFMQNINAIVPQSHSLDGTMDNSGTSALLLLAATGKHQS